MEATRKMPQPIEREENALKLELRKYKRKPRVRMYAIIEAYYRIIEE